MTRTMRWFLPVLALALPFLFATCEQGKDFEQTSKDVANLQLTVPADSFVSFPFTVTDDYRTVPAYDDDVNLCVNFTQADGYEVECIVFTEDNYFAWEQRLPCEKLWNRITAQGSNIVPSLENGNFYLVFSNRDEPGAAVALTSNCYVAYWRFK